jgi:hypothetical protein
MGGPKASIESDDILSSSLMLTKNFSEVSSVQ